MKNAVQLAKHTISIEIEALHAMSNRLNHSIQDAVDIVLETQGRVVVFGIGKSGIIGQKIASTLASTGTPAFFVHPGEAFHGDLGMIKPIDVVILISYSGETEEVIRLLPFLLYQKNKIIAMTGKFETTLARNADIVLDVSVAREACNNNLAPTSSSTATLVMGDALAVVLAVARNFQPEDFARFHPGGSLGRKLLTRVCDVMHKDNLPNCCPEALIPEVVDTISRGRLGIVLIKKDKKLLGIITDGDLRRAFQSNYNFKKIRASNIMTKNPKTVDHDLHLIEALEIMRKEKINCLVVTSPEEDAIGIIQIYDFEDLN